MALSSLLSSAPELTPDVTLPLLHTSGLTLPPLGKLSGGLGWERMEAFPVVMLRRNFCRIPPRTSLSSSTTPDDFLPACFLAPPPPLILRVEDPARVRLPF